LIKKSAFQPTQLFINSKEPKYVWKNSFYLDAQLSKFPYLGDINNLLHLNMPIEFVSSWMQIENELFSIIDTYKLKISSVSFTEAEGWYFQTSNNLRINLGSDISVNALKKLSNALKYIFEKNLTPSIIDLRYKNGAALNYGK
jgi:cell division septal protein FtsQ